MANYVLFQGDVLPNLALTATDETGAPFDLGDSCQVLFQPVNGQPGFVGAGSFVSISGNVATYQLASSDTDTVGDYYVQLVTTFGGDEQQSSRPLRLSIQARLTT